MTITDLKNSHDSVIRQKTLPSSITTDNQADLLDSLADELLSRGVKQVANTTALSALSGADHRNVIVENNGIYSWESSGTPNGTTIFAATGGGVYVRKFSSEPLYKKYVAILSQTGTNAPVATVLEDTIGIVGGDYSYVGVGEYSITKTGAFPLGKVAYFHNGAQTDLGYSFTIIHIDVNTISIRTSDSNWVGFANDVLGALPSFGLIEIRVYP